jgi:hypothetical protein
MTATSLHLNVDVGGAWPADDTVVLGDRATRPGLAPRRRTP